MQPRTGSARSLTAYLVLPALLVPPIAMALSHTPAAPSSTTQEIAEIRKAMTGTAALLRLTDTLTLESPDFSLARFALHDYLVAPPERHMPARYALWLRRDSVAPPATGGRVVWTHQSPHFYFTLLDWSAP